MLRAIAADTDSRAAEKVKGGMLLSFPGKVKFYS